MTFDRHLIRTFLNVTHIVEAWSKCIFFMAFCSARIFWQLWQSQLVDDELSDEEVPEFEMSSLDKLSFDISDWVESAQ